MASNTKDYILEVALDMFSQYGYAGTKLSELATRVGITKAALYKHYKSKEDIWLSAIAMFDEYYKALTATPEHKPTVPDSFEAFKAQELNILKIITSDSKIIQGRRLLTIEQFHDEKTASVATERFITVNVNRLKPIFTAMQNNGLLIDTNVDMLTFTYTTPISSLIQMCDREPGKQAVALKKADNFIDYFFSIFGRKPTI